jgi:hypothetical protein
LLFSMASPMMWGRQMRMLVIAFLLSRLMMWFVPECTAFAARWRSWSFRKS